MQTSVQDNLRMNGGATLTSLYGPPPGIPPGKWVFATPVMAAAWLAAAGRNRRISEVTVRAFKELMVNGDWVPTYDPVMLRPDGSLANAQHRLSAQVQCGLTLWWWVVENVTDAMVDAVDCGRFRKISDRLAIEGYENAHRDVSRVNAVLRIEKGMRLTWKASKQDVERGMKRYAEPLDWASKSIPPRGKAAHCSSATYAGAMIFAYRTAPEVVDGFAAKVKAGEMLQRGDPAYALRSYLTDRIGGKGEKISRLVAMATLRAVKGEIVGERIVILKPRPFTVETEDELVAYFAAANTQ